MHAGDLGCHERKTAPLLPRPLIFSLTPLLRSERVGCALSRRIPPFRDSSRVRSPNERPLFSPSFLFLLLPCRFAFPFFVGIYGCGRIRGLKYSADSFLRNGASIVIFENSSSLSLRTFGHVTVSFDNNRDVAERKKGDLEEISYVQFTRIFVHDSLPWYRWNFNIAKNCSIKFIIAFWNKKIFYCNICQEIFHKNTNPHFSMLTLKQCSK